MSLTCDRPGHGVLGRRLGETDPSASWRVKQKDKLEPNNNPVRSELLRVGSGALFLPVVTFLSSFMHLLVSVVSFMECPLYTGHRDASLQDVWSRRGTEV